MSCDLPEPTPAEVLGLHSIEEPEAQELDAKRQEAAAAKISAMDAWARSGVDVTALRPRRQLCVPVLGELPIIVARMGALGLRLPPPHPCAPAHLRLLIHLLRDGLGQSVGASGSGLVAFIMCEVDFDAALAFTAEVKALARAARHPEKLSEAVAALVVGGGS
jgi:hypothetical protein